MSVPRHLTHSAPELRGVEEVPLPDGEIEIVAVQGVSDCRDAQVRRSHGIYEALDDKKEVYRLIADPAIVDLSRFAGTTVVDAEATVDQVRTTGELTVGRGASFTQSKIISWPSKQTEKIKAKTNIGAGATVEHSDLVEGSSVGDGVKVSHCEHVDARLAPGDYTVAGSVVSNVCIEGEMPPEKKRQWGHDEIGIFNSCIGSRGWPGDENKVVLRLPLHVSGSTLQKNVRSGAYLAVEGQSLIEDSMFGSHCSVSRTILTGVRCGDRVVWFNSEAEGAVIESGVSVINAQIGEGVVVGEQSILDGSSGVESGYSSVYLEPGVRVRSHVSISGFVMISNNRGAGGKEKPPRQTTIHDHVRLIGSLQSHTAIAHSVVIGPYYNLGPGTEIAEGVTVGRAVKDMPQITLQAGRKTKIGAEITWHRPELRIDDEEIAIEPRFRFGAGVTVGASCVFGRREADNRQGQIGLVYVGNNNKLAAASVIDDGVIIGEAREDMPPTKLMVGSGANIGRHIDWHVRDVSVGVGAIIGDGAVIACKDIPPHAVIPPGTFVGRRYFSKFRLPARLASS